MKPVVLLIDLQDDYLRSPGIQPTADILIARATALLEGCREQHVSIIHVWTTVHRDNDRRLPHWKQNNRWLCVAGTAGHEPPASLRPLNGETMVHKFGFNAFAGGELEYSLRRLNCDAVILAGLHLHACVRTAAVECLERDLQVIIAEDAVSSNDPIHSAATRRWLAGRCVQFQPADAILSRLRNNIASKLVHRSPRETGKVLFEMPVSSAKEVSAATTAAKNAWTAWRQTKFSLRRNLLETFAARVEAVAPDLARQMAVEIGKPLSHGLEEVCRAGANVRDVIRHAAAFEPQTREAGGLVRHQPPGVVAVISPWNNPLAIPMGKIAPALIYGNTVVWKPAPVATQISLAIMRLLHESGIPDDAVQFLSGDHTTAQQLASNENVDAVTFTGSILAGYAIQEICARRTVPLQAELGGNNAAIVWDDADMPTAAAQIAWGAFGFAGQRCTANRRVIVSASNFEMFLAELKIAAEKMVWGDPLERDTDIGPVINSTRRDELERLVASARADGGAHCIEFIHESRSKEPWVKAGAYVQPVIAGCDQPEHPLVQNETMSPLLVVQRAEDFEHALALSNGVRQGLAAALFSCKPELQEKFLAESQAGILKLNMSTAGADVTLPFGGWKASGVGPPEHGTGDALFYTRMQAVYGVQSFAPEARRAI
jgi:acyl-CoA reductase-like NAD-dependent aldehyde dehydrogenase/nicotinamidase-related amidase